MGGPLFSQIVFLLQISYYSLTLQVLKVLRLYRRRIGVVVLGRQIGFGIKLLGTFCYLSSS